MMILFFLLVEKWCPSVDFREEVYRSKICIKKKKKTKCRIYKNNEGDNDTVHGKSTMWHYKYN